MEDRFPGLRMLVEDERRKEHNQDGARNDADRQAERLARNIFDYLTKPSDILGILEKRCKSLIDFFPKDSWERDFEDAESENHATAQKALFQALAKYTPCGICEHQDAKDRPSWHPARLFLMRLKSKEDLVRFDVITSSTINGSWEDLCIEIPATTVKIANEKGPDHNKTTIYLSNKPFRSELASGSHRPVNRCVPVAADINPELDHARDNGSKHANSTQLRGPRSPTSGEDFEIAIICALTHEAAAVEALFDHSWGSDDPRYHKSSGDKNAYSTGSFGRHNIVLIHMGSMGKVPAASVASGCQATFPNIKLAVVVGVCGVVPLPSGRPPGRGEIIMGDVIVSQAIVQYDFGRQYTELFEPKLTLLDSLPRPNPQIANFLAKLQTPKGEATLHKKMSSYLSTLQQIPELEACYPDTNLDILFDAKYEHRDKALSCKDAGCCGQIVNRARLIDGTPEPVVHFGLLASGDKVMKSGSQRDAEAKRYPILGFEMEGAGVWENFPSCVVIKSACDYADSHKTKGFQRYAAATAASCAKAFLDEWV
ncbi:unnamed protein product [Clonostachys rhizophaga]|uniref:Nucleoside phosphorylase domain-containing protein n=1 Tax=Clonostachys rhizophaga TaxID=160324 RepID=A0A9N9YLU6_9HYPO|nr:unnamed protein product [Clonostachys rhizophaga]